jgi:hypothetical protein
MFLESKQNQEEEKKKRKEIKKQKKKTKKTNQNQANLLPTSKNRTGKLLSKVAGQCLYHDVFTTYMRHFLPNDIHLLKDIIKDIMTTLTSRPKRCTMGPITQLNSMVALWTTNCKATTAGSSLVFEDNVGEDGLTSHSTYKVNINCPYYKASIAPNRKILNDLKSSKEQLEKVYGGMMKAVNELRLQIASKSTLSAIDCQGKSFNNNIAQNSSTKCFSN